jgi:hypothetical protein
MEAILHRASSIHGVSLCLPESRNALKTKKDVPVTLIGRFYLDSR